MVFLDFETGRDNDHRQRSEGSEPMHSLFASPVGFGGSSCVLFITSPAHTETIVTKTENGANHRSKGNEPLAGRSSTAESISSSPGKGAVAMTLPLAFTA